MKTPKPFYDRPIIEELDLESLEAEKVHKLRVNMVTDPMGDYMQVPVIVAKGASPGPVVGITAAIHGDELNGTLLIHNLIPKLDLHTMAGTVVAVPIMNVHGFKAQSRDYWDGSDLNRVMPGKEDGTAGQIYAYNLIQKLVNRFNYLIDLHTASIGRVNSLYVRADLNDECASKMAYLQRPQIIVNTTQPAGTLRREAQHLLRIPSITIEIGNPLTFQRVLIRKCLLGIFRVLDYLKVHALTNGENEPEEPPPILCRESYWIRAEQGGLLQVFPALAEFVEKGERIALLTNAFGDLIHEYHAEEKGVVIGMDINPVCLPGSRILHLGLPFDSDAG